MENRSIGNLVVSSVGLGCNNFGLRIPEPESREVIFTALEAGVTLFDTADVYGRGQSEEILGAALAGRRDQVTIATKFGYPLDGPGSEDASATNVRKSIEASLRRLQTDYVDLYQLHRLDPRTPPAETLEALHMLVEKGVVREIGCSDFGAADIEQWATAAWEGHTADFVSVQNEYSLLHRSPEHEVLAACDEFGLVFLPYYPLADGLLTGKYRAGLPPPPGTRLAKLQGERLERTVSDERFEIVAALTALADEAGRSVLDLAIGWLCSRPRLASVIAGATKPEQVRANIAAAEWIPDESLLRAIDAIVPPGWPQLPARQPASSPHPDLR